eukprot:UN31948
MLHVFVVIIIVEFYHWTLRNFDTKCVFKIPEPRYSFIARMMRYNVATTNVIFECVTLIFSDPNTKKERFLSCTMTMSLIVLINFVMMVSVLSFMFVKQLSLRTVLWESQSNTDEEITTMANKLIFKTSIVCIIWVGFYAYEAIHIVANLGDNCLASNFEPSKVILVTLALTSMLHLYLLWQYVKIVMLFINVEHETLMIFDVEERKYYDYLFWITKLHLASTFVIIGTTWLRYTVGFTVPV